MTKSSYTIYMAEIGKEKSMTIKEQTEHFTAYKENGSRKAFNSLLTRNAKFVVKMAHNYKNQGLDLEDLIGVGNLGLARAIEDFEYKTSTLKFISYAVWWIRQHMLNELAKQSRFLSITTAEAYMKQNIDKADAKLRQKLTRKPTVFELATELQSRYGLKQSIKHITHMTVLEPQASIYKPIGSDGNAQLHDILEDKNTLKADDELIEGELPNRIGNILDNMKSLKKMDCIVLKLYFGINKHKLTYNYQEIGDLYGLTRQRIEQICNKSLAKVRAHGKLGLELV